MPAVPGGERWCAMARPTEAEKELVSLVEKERQRWESTNPGPMKDFAFDVMSALHFRLTALRLMKKNVAHGVPS